MVYTHTKEVSECPDAEGSCYVLLLLTGGSLINAARAKSMTIYIFVQFHCPFTGKKGDEDILDNCGNKTICPRNDDLL